ncbi:uncharacterized protein LOC135399657 [Ornithodoros turicata]|uniref:uncharacterized protein LOC135399657 n=1 Tax=Ornithodoros turicata TaxID=34597 RepID=UPI0031390A1A
MILYLLLILLCSVVVTANDPSRILGPTEIAIVVKDGFSRSEVGLPECNWKGNCSSSSRTCNNGTTTCACPSGFKMNKGLCVYTETALSDTGVIYKVTLIVAAIFMVLIFFIFVGCLVKKTCDRAREYSARLQEANACSVYVVPREFQGLEKPPSYIDIVKMDNMIYGVPPPEYGERNPGSPTGGATHVPPAPFTRHVPQEPLVNNSTPFCSAQTASQRSTHAVSDEAQINLT